MLLNSDFMFVDHLPFSLGTSFEEISLDLKFIKSSFQKEKIYRSYRHTELYLFEKVYQPSCFLTFKEDFLFRITYYFELHEFDFLYERILNDLPKGYTFFKDPLVSNEEYCCFFDRFYICINRYEDSTGLIVSRPYS